MVDLIVDLIRQLRRIGDYIRGIELIDEKGNLFGIVNVIDFLVLIVLIAVLIGGISLVTGSSGSSSSESDLATFVIECDSEEIVYEAAKDDRSIDDDVEVIEFLSIEDRYYGFEEHSDRVIYRIAVRVDVDHRDDRMFFRGERIYIGRNLTIETNTTRIDCQVVA